MKKLLTLAIAFLPLAVFAHGGHSSFDPTTLIHYLGTPEHALPGLAVAAVAAWLLFRRRKARA
jgi:hypothetical protein